MDAKHTFSLPLFIANDAVDEDFIDYLSDEAHKEIHQLIRSKRYTVKATDVSYRVINHWEEKGILPENCIDDGDGWRKFTFVEIVWLQVVKCLREYGLSLDLIKKVRESVMVWNEKENTYPWFEYYVIKAKTSRMDSYIAVLPDGQSSLTFSRTIESGKFIFGSRSFILISLKEILSSLNLSSPKPEFLLPLSSEEIGLVDVVRNAEVDKIAIKLKNGKLKSIDTSKTISGSDIGSIKKEIEELGDFADVIVKFEKGKEQSAEVIRKKRF